MHVTLVHPPTVATVTTMVQEAVPPLGLAYVCAALRSRGFDVTVIDAVGSALDRHTIYSTTRRSLLRGLTPDDIVARLPDRTDVIGVSCMFSNAWGPTRALIVRLKKARPTVPIVLGGEHATACWDYILRTCPEVDACVLGEAEDTICELVDCLQSGADPAGVPGLALRSSHGQPSKTQPRPRLRDLGAIPRPAWDAFPLEAYIDGHFNHGVHRGRSMPILASRGCPHGCTFCSSPNMWTRRWVARDPADVLDEMKQWIARYKVNDFTFYDLTAIVGKAWITEFAQLLIAARLDVTWQLPSGTRSEAIDHQVARLMFESGCRAMNFAPESGSAAVLRRMNKTVDLGRMRQSIRDACRAGIDVKVNIILGFPGETVAEVRETIAFVADVARLGAEAVSVFPFCAYPGSEVVDGLVDRCKIRLDDAYFDDLVFTDYGRIVSYNERFSPRQLSALVLAANAVFYGVQLRTHPGRTVALARQVLSRSQTSKVANAIEPMRARKDVYARLLRSARAGNP